MKACYTMWTQCCTKRRCKVKLTYQTVSPWTHSHIIIPIVYEIVVLITIIITFIIFIIHVVVDVVCLVVVSVVGGGVVGVKKGVRRFDCLRAGRLPSAFPTLQFLSRKKMIMIIEIIFENKNLKINNNNNIKIVTCKTPKVEEASTTLRKSRNHGVAKQQSND